MFKKYNYFLKFMVELICKIHPEQSGGRYITSTTILIHLFLLCLKHISSFILIKCLFYVFVSKMALLHSIGFSLQNWHFN